MFISPRALKRIVVLSVLGLVILVVGQTAYRPKTGVVTRIGSAKITPPTQRPAPVLAPTNPAINAVAKLDPPTVDKPKLEPKLDLKPERSSDAKRMFAIYGGQFEVSVDEVPLIGSATNQYVAVTLFDYTCHHCRDMHPRLVEVQNRFSNSLVVVSLPMPLDPMCNPTVQRSHPMHTNACEYARVGLAVWRANPTKQREFDDWLFAPAQPPALPEAVQHAIELIGAAAFNQAYKDPWVELQLKQNVAIYESAYRAGQGSMPQIILGQNVAVGIFTVDELIKLLADNLGLKTGP